MKITNIASQGACRLLGNHTDKDEKYPGRSQNHSFSFVNSCKEQVHRSFDDLGADAVIVMGYQEQCNLVHSLKLLSRFPGDEKERQVGKEF